MPEKECRHCSQTKPVAEFYTSRESRDGYQAWCKECHRGRRRNLEPLRRSNRKWRKANLEKRSAHQAVYYAIRTGRLERPSCCSECGAGGDIHAHHEDHSKPLDVRWLCRLCHAAADREASHAA